MARKMAGQLCGELSSGSRKKVLEGTRWFRYLWEAADCALKEAEELTETAMKTCQLQDGPELYLEALEKI